MIFKFGLSLCGSLAFLMWLSEKTKYAHSMAHKCRTERVQLCSGSIFDQKWTDLQVPYHLMVLLLAACIWCWSLINLYPHFIHFIQIAKNFSYRRKDIPMAKVNQLGASVWEGICRHIMLWPLLERLACTQNLPPSSLDSSKRLQPSPSSTPFGGKRLWDEMTRDKKGEEKLSMLTHLLKVLYKYRSQHIDRGPFTQFVSLWFIKLGRELTSQGPPHASPADLAHSCNEVVNYKQLKLCIKQLLGTPSWLAFPPSSVSKGNRSFVWWIGPTDNWKK